jgi:caffeoyl-CoA O-methyltransferase
MDFISEELDQYCSDHSSQEPEYLRALQRETWQKIVMPRMLSGHLQGRYLSLISKMLQPKTILEIGAYTGYSAYCLAEGLRRDGKLFSVDINDELAWIHEKYRPLSPQANQIQFVYGDGQEVIPTLNEDWDLIFIDADKENYQVYFDMLIPKLKSGAVILLDNVLWSGKVLDDPKPSDKETIVLKKLNASLSKNDLIDCTLLPLRDGVMMVRKR